MRLVARLQYDGKDCDLRINELSAKELKAVSVARSAVTGVPVYWARVGAALEFWPVRNAAYCAIVDLDTGEILAERGEAMPIKMENRHE